VKWHWAKPLRESAAAVLGHTDDQRKLHLELEPIVDRLWSQGDRDFGWYDTPMYAYSCVECFLDFTKGAVGGFADWVNSGEQTKYSLKDGYVLDIGCGIGASTRYFKELTGLPKVVGQNFPLAKAQQRVADEVAPGLAMQTTVEHALEIFYPLVIMAFELFEHVDAPLAFVDEFGPSVGIIAEVSSFHIDNYGHFPEYHMDGATVPRSKAARAFTEGMKRRGWDVVHSGWNSKPRVWAR
jgi:SAM-dependent methyltransferase